MAEIDVPNLITHDPSSTESFAALGTVNVNEGKRRIKAVVIGGGTGAPVSIRTLLSMGVETSAVVAMADDGGSTGILREELGATTPGDVRKCITAMAADPADPMTKAFKMRFSFAENHTLGNLMLTALEVASGSFPEAIRICEEILGARGHVYSSTLDRITLVARTVNGRIIEGQAVACHSRETLESIRLKSDTPITAYQPAVDAILGADMIVLGPGSLFTSIIPNLTVPGIVEAIRASKAKVVFVCSLADMQGETRGMRVIDYYDALERHGMTGVIDYMLVHDYASSQGSYAQAPDDDVSIKPVRFSKAELAEIEACGTKVKVSNLVDERRLTWHDPSKLRDAFAEVIHACRLPRK